MHVVAAVEVEPRPEVHGHLFHALDLRRRAGGIHIWGGQPPYRAYKNRRAALRQARHLARAQKHEDRARRLEAEWTARHPAA